MQAFGLAEGDQAAEGAVAVHPVVTISSPAAGGRNARTHASHDPVDWKYHHIGNYFLSDVPPPNHGQI